MSGWKVILKFNEGNSDNAEDSLNYKEIDFFFNLSKFRKIYEL